MSLFFTSKRRTGKERQMVCRCATAAEHQARAQRQSRISAQRAEESLRQKLANAEKEIAALTPDPSQAEIVDAVEVGTHLVLKVRYPSCVHRSFEGEKVMVFLNQKALDALRWKRIDPHFSGPEQTKARKVQDAPSPAARFPASEQGWKDAQDFARMKS